MSVHTATVDFRRDDLVLMDWRERSPGVVEISIDSEVHLVLTDVQLAQLAAIVAEAAAR